MRYSPWMQDWVYVDIPAGEGPFPVVVFFHHGPGFDDGSKEAVKLIADAGYYVAAIDRYRRFEPWAKFDLAKLRDPNPENPERDRFMTMLTGTSDEDVEADVSEVLLALEDERAAREGASGCIGFCIGARSVLRTMANHPDKFAAGVALHPSFCVTDEAASPHLAVPNLPGHVYVGLGAADQLSPVEANEPLIEAVSQLGVRGTAEIHDDADHGFAVPRSPSYHQAAAARSYEQALALFRKVL